MGLGVDGVLTYPFTKLKVGGRGDLENALNYTATSQYNLFINGGANVKKWAKYKAFQDAKVFTDRYNDAGTSARDVALKAANYGMTNIPIWGGVGTQRNSTPLSYPSNFLFGGGNSTYAPDCGVQSEYWKYIKPSEWTVNGAKYRALDFERYFTKAVAPVGSMIGTPAVGSNGHLIISFARPNLLGYNLDFINFQFQYVANPTTSPTVTTIQAADMYPCVLMHCYSGTNIGTFILLCSQSKLSANNTYTFDFNVTNVRTYLYGSWESFCFLSKDKYSEAAMVTPNNVSGVFVQISGVSQYQMTQSTINYDFTIKSAGFAGAQAEYFDTTVTLSNLDPSTAITSFTLAFKYYSDHGTTEISGSAYSHTYTQTVAANGSADITYRGSFGSLGGLNVQRVQVTVSGIVPATFVNHKTVYQDIYY